MKGKKGIIFVLASFLLLLNLVSAINLDITKNTLSNSVITNLNQPAKFELVITNRAEGSNFQIYSLVGVDISPTGSVYISQDETKKVTIEVLPQDSIKKNLGFYTFEYKIRDAKGEVQSDMLTINILDLKNAFDFYADSFTPVDNKTIIHFNNKADFDFKEITALFSSTFFSEEKTFSLAPHEKKQIEVSIDKEQAKTILAGTYLLNARITLDGKKESLSSIIQFLEQSGIETTETKEGFLINRYEIEKKNKGNIPVDASIIIKKDLFSALFTTFSIAPTDRGTMGVYRVYRWNANIIPDENLKVVVKTNFILPVIIILAIILLYFVTKRYLTSDLILRKKATFVRTRGGEFALKISILAKARRATEKIRVIDKIPSSLTIYNRFGAIAPDRIDEKNRRIEWNLESLNTGEERVLSYIVYSKISVIGKFELQEATAIYESNGKVKETSSNNAFFINEVKKESSH